MGRTVRNGLNGQFGAGKITLGSNIISTTQTNTDLTIDPNGTGVVKVTSDFLLNGTGSAAGEMRLGDADSSNWVGFKSPATVSSNKVWVLPSADGTASQVLKTDGSGNLGWLTVSIALADETSSASTYYPLLQSSVSGTASTLYGSSTKLSYQPSTGIMTVGTITGSTGAGSNLVLRSTSNASKGQVYIDETTASSSVTTGALRVGGGVGISGTLYVASLVETSSITYKENLNPIVDALDKVVKLTGYTYDRKDIDKKNESGLIAEYVEQVLPNLVSRDENGVVNGVQYTKLTAYLVEAIKTLSNEVTELKAKLG
jgi:hypothetical protein